MDVRSASPDDTSRLREIARSTFNASYSLSPAEIEALTDELFSDDALTDRLESVRCSVLVAESQGDIIGFADIEMGDPWVVQWLHVDPEARGQGAGTALFERIIVGGQKPFDHRFGLSVPEAPE